LGLLRKSYYILGDFVFRLPLMFVLLLSTSLMDLVGIGLVVPFIALLSFNGVIVDEYAVFMFFLGDVDNETVILSLGGVLVFTFFVKGFLAFFVQRKILSLGYEIRESLIDNIILSYQRMKYEELILKDISAIIVNVNTHVGLFVDAVFVPILRMIIEIMVAIGILLFVAMTSPVAMMGVSIILMTITFLYYKFVKVRMSLNGRIMSLTEAEVIIGVNNIFGAFKEIRLLGVEDYFRFSIGDKVRSFGKAGVITRTLPLAARYIIEACMALFIVLITIYLISINTPSEEIFSTLTIFGIAAVRLVPSISQLSAGLANVRAGSYALHSLYDSLLSLTPDEIKGSNKAIVVDITESFKSLKLIDVTYAYSSNNIQVLKKSCLSITKGDFICIIGESGSGKSTLMNVMLGLLDPLTGEVVINDRKLNVKEGSCLWLEWWYKQVAYIPQDVFLVNGSIRENIALGIQRDDVNEERMQLAVQGARLEKLIMEQCDVGLDSEVGGEGVLLSGGQKQRIAIARALYSEREVIFMDEATSALDEVTAADVMSHINSIKEDITVILVTHRKASLIECNKIYEIVGGKVEEVVGVGAFYE